MNKKIKTLFLFCAAMCVIFTMSCSSEDGRGKLSETLYADYTADISFSMSENGQTLDGRATVSKGDKCVITFAAPDALEALSVESDENGESGILQFSYYGMRLPLPDGALGKINLLLSAFSREMTGNIVSVPKKNIVDYEDDLLKSDMASTQSKLKKTEFLHHDGKTQCVLIYDSLTGHPVSLQMNDGVKNIDIWFEKIKITS